MPAVAGPGAAAPALTVTRASVVAVWKESYLLKGRSVRFSGSVAGPAQLRAFIRPAAGGATLITKDFSVPAAGAFNGLVLPLPARPLPGAYTLRVFGTASGAQLPAVDRTVRIPAPATGIVDQAIASATPRRAQGALGRRPAERSALPFPLHLPAEGEQGAGGVEDAVRPIRRVRRWTRARRSSRTRRGSTPGVRSVGAPLTEGRWWCYMQIACSAHRSPSVPSRSGSDEPRRSARGRSSGEQAATHDGRCSRADQEGSRIADDWRSRIAGGQAQGMRADAAVRSDGIERLRPRSST